MSALVWSAVCTCATANARGLDTNSSLHHGLDFRQKDFGHTEVTVFKNSPAGCVNLLRIKPENLYRKIPHSVHLTLTVMPINMRLNSAMTEEDEQCSLPGHLFVKGRQPETSLQHHVACHQCCVVTGKFILEGLLTAKLQAVL